MAKQWVLKLDRQDDDQGHVLIRVTAKDEDDLDLDLLATEGAEVYKGKVRRNDLNNIRATAYNGKDHEWSAILQYALLPGRSSVISQEQKRSLEVGVSLQEQKGKPVLSIKFRNRIDDITQRIGAIDLFQTSKEISLFDWTALALDKNKALEAELSALSERTNEDQATIARLTSQLADLVKAKAEHEEQMLSKFVLLLNEKKTKIRDQERIMQTARLEKDKLQRLSRSIAPDRSRNTTRRISKRSAPDQDSEEDESQAFETQEDARREPGDELDIEIDSDQQTTPGSTESEADDNDELPIRAKKSDPRKASPKSMKKSAPAPASIPPARSLPFTSNSGYSIRSEGQPKTPPKASHPASEEDEETASEDDEL